MEVAGTLLLDVVEVDGQSCWKQSRQQEAPVHDIGGQGCLAGSNRGAPGPPLGCGQDSWGSPVGCNRGSHGSLARYGLVKQEPPAGCGQCSWGSPVNSNDDKDPTTTQAADTIKQEYSETNTFLNDELMLSQGAHNHHVVYITAEGVSSHCIEMVIAHGSRRREE